MRRRSRISYSIEELAWIKSNRTLSRRDLHQQFVVKFERQDVRVEDIKALCTRKKWNTGRDGRFQKGNIPPNKGRKGYCPPGCEKGWFKKGNKPHNTKYAGHERTDADGYVWVSVEEVNPHTGFERRYVMKHRHLWEKEHGSIPEKHCLKCLDGNKQNTDPSNWKLIPRSMLPRLNNQWGRDYENAQTELKTSILAIAELEQKASDVEKQASA